MQFPGATAPANRRGRPKRAVSVSDDDYTVAVSSSADDSVIDDDMGTCATPTSTTQKQRRIIGGTAPAGLHGRGRGRGRGQGAHKLVRGVGIAKRNLPRCVAADSCVGLLAADIDPFITELARRKQGSLALQGQVDALKLDTAMASATRETECAVLEQLIKKLLPFEAKLAPLTRELGLLKQAVAASGNAHLDADASARVAELITQAALLTAAKNTPDIYDGFENDYAKAFLLLMHNTNLGSCPALGRLRGMPDTELNLSVRWKHASWRSPLSQNLSSQRVLHRWKAITTPVTLMLRSTAALPAVQVIEKSLLSRRMSA